MVLIKYFPDANNRSLAARAQYCCNNARKRSFQLLARVSRYRFAVTTYKTSHYALKFYHPVCNVCNPVITTNERTYLAISAEKLREKRKKQNRTCAKQTVDTRVYKATKGNGPHICWGG